MKIRNILVEVSQGTPSAARLQTALNLAGVLGSRVTALFVVPHFVPSTMMAGTVHGGWYAGAQIIEQYRQDALKSAEEAKQASMQIAEKNSMELDWIAVEGDVADVTADAARYHDILMVGVPDTVNEPKFYDSDLGSILMKSGRPVVVVPGVEPMLEKVPEIVMIAWDGGRESTKAVLESMPFLEQARSVLIVSVWKRKEQKKALTEQAELLAQYLATHEIDASAHVVKREDRSTARQLVDFADSKGVELIVMGAYGHSRFQELVLGGVTRDILHNASVPVLFAH